MMKNADVKFSAYYEFLE